MHKGWIAVVRVAGALLVLAAVALATVPANAELAGKPVYCNGVPPFFIGAPSDPGPEGFTPKDNACMDAAFTRVGWAMLVGLLGVGAVGATVWVTRSRKTASRAG